MSELEKLMFKVLGNISNTNAPIVFKGALIAKLALAECGYDDISRMTTDIDANWVGESPSNEELVKSINDSLSEMDEELYAELFRECEGGRSAGIAIKEKNTGDEIIQMDISITPVINSKTYYYGETKINGILPNEIIADKIYLLSSKNLLRRIKDMVDVYAFSNCMNVDMSEIFEICKSKNRAVKRFREFFSQRDNIKKAYNDLNGVEGKPPFDEIYSYMSDFFRPFARKHRKGGTWDCNTKQWTIEQAKSVNKIENYLLH